MSDYDLCVIGAGPAGYSAAVRAWDFGKRVALVEKSELGGTGVHNGALSSKTLWELSRDYRGALRRNRGFVAENVTVDFAQVAHCVDIACQEKVSQLRRQLQELSRSRVGKPGSITLIRGAARFLDARRVTVEGQDGVDRTIAASHFLIATGSRPRPLPGVEIDGQFVMTSDHLMGLDRFPRSLVVIGAGVVGCEFATIFANYGRTKVHVIDRADRILPFEDEDISRICSTNLERAGVTIHHRARLVELHHTDDGVAYTIEHHTGGRERIEVERALVSIGREPNTRGLDLQQAGVRLNESGHIVEDDTQTTQPHIYAVGDVTLDTALVSVGEIEARHAVERMFGGQTQALQLDNISTIYFLDPEVAAIGMNEQTAQQKKVPYRVAVYGYALVNRAIAMRATDGFVKILTTDDDEMRILGMRAAGVHASTTIEAVSLMMKAGHGVREIAELLHPHPAVTEAVQDCVRMLLGTSIYKPHVFQSELRLSRITYESGEPVERTMRGTRKSPAAEA
jgi:dihydrolipoamide dehydrogenase